jgi:hypothetical protein
MMHNDKPSLDDITICMKGRGFYDRNCNRQETVVARVESVLEDVINAVDIAAAPQPFTIVDYGCAEGRNSLRISNYMIRLLKERGLRQEVHVIHNDLADNDFASLIDVVVDEHRGRGGKLEPHCDGAVIRTLAPGSFYNQVASPQSVAFGLSTTSVHWLANTGGVRVADHVSAEGAAPFVREQMASVARRDWVRFLRCRAEEMVPGGRLVVTMLGRAEDDQSVHAPFRLLNDVAQHWLRQGRVSLKSYENFVIPVYRRTLTEASAPFAEEGELSESLLLNHCEQFRVPCPFQSQFESDGDRTAYAQRYAGFVRAVSEPLVAHLLDAGNPLCMDHARVDAFFADVETRAAESPGEYAPTHVHVLVVATRR